MKTILAVAALAVYMILVIGDFVLMPEAIFIPVSLALSASIFLGAPYAVRRFACAKPMPMPLALGATLSLVGIVYMLFAAITPEKLTLFAIICLLALNAVLALLCVVLLTQDKQGSNGGVAA